MKRRQEKCKKKQLNTSKSKVIGNLRMILRRAEITVDLVLTGQGIDV